METAMKNQLTPLKFKPYTAKELKPSGWLKRQLRIQADGLSGNLDKMWRDVKDSKWIGGDCDGWERVPYWLDGFIPLAWLLDDEDMKRRAKTYIDAILAGQQEDGWICPCEESERGRYDMWALFLICKVLVVYYECSGDERIEDAVYRALKQLCRHVEAHTLFDWASARWYECLIPLFWLYERRPEDWMLYLAGQLDAQGCDFEKLYEHWPYEKPQEFGRWGFLSHVVNTAMMLKSRALMTRIYGGDANAFAKKALGILQRDHGMATGHFTGDECLSGTAPIQGSECCSVVEAMYSYEHLLSITGDSYWGDILERLAFNALPATISPDMWTHQYDQMTNQVQCCIFPKGKQPFFTNSEESNLFGLEPNFGCCTANFNQGWPKFALSTLMKTDTGVAVTALAPAVVHDEIQGVPVQIEVDTLYPFRDSLTVRVKTEQAVPFTLDIRIPGFATSAQVNGKEAQPGTFYRLDSTWQGEQEVTVQLCFAETLTQRPSGMVCVDRGPLLFSVKVEEEWKKLEYTRDGVERKFPYCDYEIFPKSKWNYAFVNDKFQRQEAPVGDPWKLINGVCEAVPQDTTPISGPVEVTLIPYGCTNLRLTEAPYLPGCGR